MKLIKLIMKLIKIIMKLKNNKYGIKVLLFYLKQ